MIVRNIYPHTIDVPGEAMGDVADPAVTSGPFVGCQNDNQLSLYLARSAFAWSLRGLASGVGLGVLGTCAALYWWNRR